MVQRGSQRQGHFLVTTCQADLDQGRSVHQLAVFLEVSVGMETLTHYAEETQVDQLPGNARRVGLWNRD